jgi:hypothetical protein
MRADLCGGAVVFGDLRHCNPALGSQACRLVRIGADGQEQTAAFALREAGVNQRIDIGGEADGWFGTNAVAAPAPDFA